MRILCVRHVTTYRYKQPVGFGEHRLMLFPRDDDDQSLLELKLEIVPKPSAVLWCHDSFANRMAVARFTARAAALSFTSTFRVEHFTDLEPTTTVAAHQHPPSDGAQDLPGLMRFIGRQCADPEHRLDAWVRQVVGQSRSTNTLALLEHLTRTIHETLTYRARHEKGIQDPLLTLEAGSGSCRDLALLMIEAVRTLGMAARFVSGYLHVRAAPEKLAPGGNTHAWVQVYVPGTGWLDFDPSSGTVGNRDLVRVAVVREPSEALPLHGTWTGCPSDSLGMEVNVQVTAEDPQEVADAAALA